MRISRRCRTEKRADFSVIGMDEDAGARSTRGAALPVVMDTCRPSVFG
jgi:hypothetical protein